MGERGGRVGERDEMVVRRAERVGESGGKGREGDERGI